MPGYRFAFIATFEMLVDNDAHGYVRFVILLPHLADLLLQEFVV